jgi:hypothetical protein
MLDTIAMTIESVQGKLYRQSCAYFSGGTIRTIRTVSVIIQIIRTILTIRKHRSAIGAIGK